MITEYIAHFGLKETPFARNHDPKWLYVSTQQKEAIVKARWTIQEHGGLALIRGDVGHGKSFLIEYLMTVWPHQFGWRCAKLQNTATITTPRALLAEVLAAFGLEPSWNARDMAIRLENWLLTKAYEDKQTVVLFIDEAQSLDSHVFPVLRDLVNLEVRERILLQIVLSAQLNIDRKLTYFPALQSRIASVSTLEPLSAGETEKMLLHRFRTAGAANCLDFCPTETMRAIHAHSAGVPRDILVVAEAAMKEAFLQGSNVLCPEHVAKAVRDLAGRRPRLAKVA
ncbi:MAG TPA: AAA family ATPase [Chthonomonadaceae bacterium]|nr:AAA family ATPase [Chthonomonadaceae bacterium]